ncbi:MAG: hypothetical protein RSB38_02670, partial [Oscillospiraceae bacterium]
MHSVIITISSVYTTLRQKIGNGEQISENIINHELRIDVLKDYFKKLYTTLEGDLIKENRVDAVRNYVVMYIKENYS